MDESNYSKYQVHTVVRFGEVAIALENVPTRMLR